MQETRVWSRGQEEMPPWRKKWQPTPVFLPGKSHEQRSLKGYSPWGRKRMWPTEQLSTHTHCIVQCSSEILYTAIKGNISYCIYFRLVWLYSLQPKMEKLYTVSKKRLELTVAKIMNSLLANSDLKKVRKTTRPFRYDLNQIPYDYTVKVTNRFKVLDLMFFWKSLAFSMIQRMLVIWSLVPLPFLKPAWTSGSSQFTYCWSLAWRILSIT